MARTDVIRLAGVLRDNEKRERTALSDSELLDRFRKHRDNDAFATIVRRHGKTVLAACRQVLTDQADIDDAFQAAFLVLIQKIARIDGRTVGSWLYAVAHRIAVRVRSDVRRRSRREGAAAKRQKVEVQPPDFSWREAVAILHEEVDRMPDAYRRVLLLCYLSGQSREEAASSLGWTAGAVKGRLERGRKMLASRLARRGITVSVGLLSVATGQLAGMDGPPARMIELARDAASGAIRPAVAALTQGVLPMTGMVKRCVFCLVAVTGFAAIVSLGHEGSSAEPPAKTAATAPSKTPASDPTAVPEKKNEAAPTIHGLVKDASGTPVADATVLAVGEVGNGERISTTTDAQGKFTVIAPASKSAFKSVLVIAVRDGFAAGTAYTTRDNPDEIQIALPPATHYGGTVKDSTGRPVVGAELQVGFMNRGARSAAWGFLPAEAVRGTAAEEYYFTRTDSSGRFSFTRLAEGNEVIFRVSAKGFAELDTGAGGSPPRKHVVKRDAKPPELVLQPESVIRGRIVSRVEGVALDSGKVQIEGYKELHGFRRTVKPERDGTFTVNGLPAGSMGLSLVLPSDVPATAAGVEVKTAVGEPTQITIEMIAGVEVSGRVRVRGTNEPLAEVQMATLGLLSPNGFQFGSKPTDKDGKFSMRLPPGKVTLLTWTMPAGFNRAEPQRVEIEVPANATKFSIPEPFEVIRVAKSLNGQVVDAGGKPVQHVKVRSLQNAGPCGDPESAPVVASFDGRFTLAYSMNGPLEPGRSIPLRVELSDGRQFEACALVVKEGIAAVRLPTFPDLAGTRDVKPDEFAGMVVNEKGKPLAGVKVHVWDWVDKPENYTFTGADGIFRIKEPSKNQRVQVRFSKDGYAPVWIARQQVGVPGLVIALDRSTYFEGVVRQPDGKPAAGAVIRADCGSKMLEGGCVVPNVWTETTADAEGRYRLYVQPDEYAFHIKCAGVGVKRVSKTGIAFGQARQFDIQLEPGITFQARVINSVTGKPIAGLRLFNWQQKEVEACSNDRGDVAIADMLPGEFTFNVESERYTRWWCEQATHSWERMELVPQGRPGGFRRNFDNLTFNLKPGMGPVTIVAEPAVRITGKVLDPNGKPVAGATVAPALTGTGNSLTGDTRFSVETKADGTFVMMVPSSAAVEYNLVAHDGKYGEWRSWANGVLPPMKTAPGQAIENVTLKLTRPAVVRGKVVDGNGRPVAGREVRAHAADLLENRYYDPTTMTNADGTFELKLVRPTEQFIKVYPFWLQAGKAPEGTSRTLKLKEGEVVDNVVLVAEEQK